jgi:hypothetical protein
MTKKTVPIPRGGFFLLLISLLTHTFFVDFFCLSKRNRRKKRTASGFRRPTNGSIPKPAKPFVPVRKSKNHFTTRYGTHFCGWLFTESSPSGCPAENPKANWLLFPIFPQIEFPISKYRSPHEQHWLARVPTIRSGKAAWDQRQTQLRCGDQACPA